MMKRHVLIYGLIGGLLITGLKWAEYRFLVIEHSIEIYGGLIALTFAGLGIWLGIKLTSPGRPVVMKGVAADQVPAAVVAGHATDLLMPTEKSRDAKDSDAKIRNDLGITPREFEILELIAKGMSNREIAQRLFVSENTVKTHSSRVFGKLGARRRTQAVQLGKEFGLLP